MLTKSTSSSSLPNHQADSCAPTIQVTLSKSVYRPGDIVTATIDIDNFRFLNNDDDEEMLDSLNDVSGSFQEASRVPEVPLLPAGLEEAILIESLDVEMKGVERLDASWIRIPNGQTLPVYSKGERAFLEAPSLAIARDLLIGFGESRTYSVLVTLPPVIPPSYKGTAIKYHYYLSVWCKWSPVLTAASGNSAKSSRSLKPQEVRVPVRIWTQPQSSGLTEDELGAEDHYGAGGITPTSTLLMDIKCKELTARTLWVPKSGSRSGEEDDDSSVVGEDVPSNLPLGRLEDFHISERVQSAPGEGGLGQVQPAMAAFATVSEAGVEQRGAEGSGSRASRTDSRMNGFLNGEGSHRSNSMPERAPNGQISPTRGYHFEFESRHDLPGSSQSQQWEKSPLQKDPEELAERNPLHGSVSQSESAEDDSFQEGDEENGPVASAPVPAQGRAYNIRIDDSVLVKFTPRKSEPVYCLGDSVSGTLSFSQDPSSRKCLAISVFLETHEVVNPVVLHPSRRVSSRDQQQPPVHIPSIQTEFHEITANMSHSHFMFTIPMDAAAAFATPMVSVQWILRFEFVVSERPRVGGHPPANSKTKAPEKGAWSLPLAVHTPVHRLHPSGVTGQVAFSKSQGGKWSKPLLLQPIEGGKRLPTKQGRDSESGFSRNPSMVSVNHLLKGEHRVGGGRALSSSRNGSLSDMNGFNR